MSDRPMYETQEDLKNEFNIKCAIEQITGTHLIKLPIKYYADFIAWKELSPCRYPFAIIEAKKRTTARLDHRAYVLSLHKAVNVISYSELLNIPFLMFVKWTDDFGYIEITRDLINSAIGQVTKSYRNDPGDIEPCIFIKTELFKLLQ
jgi:hypothetical protein